LYCPSFSEYNDTNIWNYDIVNHSSIKVVGFAFAFSGTGDSLSGLFTTNWNTTLSTPATITIVSGGRVSSVTIPPSARELAADATICQNGSFTAVKVNWAQPARSPHLNRSIAAGGNVLFLDGHVQWRKFNDMPLRGIGHGSAGLVNFYY
jgi:prepilin-type processing-associated H-X9-DG protein